MMSLESLLNLPGPVRFLLGLLTATSLLGAVALIDSRLVFIVLIGMIVLTGALVAYHYLLKRLQARKSAALSGQIQQHGAAAPNAISNPGQRAKLDAMKRSFEVGMDKFRSSGKDVYTLPWYVIVGEPGAGKTEAIRHCNVGFPPGLQDEMQGVGGTINMNWWFTNRAVLLDTAGRLMFEEVVPGETHEWPEFLKLLRRNRPTCPINGLLLVIPCDSLVKDSEAEVTRKAGKIAQQLEVIQRTLDVRFPVFVLITKSDLLDGFREFFDDMDAESQHQMLGWSNPEPRDAPFRPDLVDLHLQTVIARIRKRRLGLLKDPIPQKGASRRADEVDALFSLPESFSLAAPRLRSYLEKIFVAGPWSAKPLFLRGIYFTSAMREGAALDLVLAQAIGVRVDDLPEGRAWERERAYFLRDLFTEKIFREFGLVTRASNTRVLLRTRQIVLYGFGFLAFALLLLFSILSYRDFEQSIGEQSQSWAFAAQGWQNGRWHPVITPTAGDQSGRYDFNGDAPIDPTGGPTTVAEFQHKLRDLCDKEIRIGWVFRPLARFFHLEDRRKQAQQIVFTASIVKPLLEGDRVRMLTPAPDPGSATTPPDQAALREGYGIAALLRVEADALSKSGVTESRPESILKPGIQYATDQDAPAGLEKSFPLLSADFERTYSHSTEPWPQPWLAKGSGSLAENRPIRSGLDRMFAFLNTSLQTQETSLATIKDLRDDLREFRRRESSLNDQAKTDQRANLDAQMSAKLDDLKKIKAAIDAKLKSAQDAGMLRDFSLNAEYLATVEQSKAQSEAAFKIVRAAAANAGGGPQALLFPEVIKALDQKHNELIARISNNFTKDEIAELPGLDELLKDFGDGRRMYEVRANQYKLAEDEMHEKDAIGDLLGSGWTKLVELQDKLKRFRDEAKATQEKLGGKFDAHAYFVDRAEELRTSAIVDSYLRQTRTAFSGNFFAPYVEGPGSSGGSRVPVSKLKNLLSCWHADMNSENMKLVLPDVSRQKLKNFVAETDKIGPIIDSEEKRNAVRINLELVSYTASPDKTGLDRLREVMVGGSHVDTGSDISLGSYSVDSDHVSVTFHDYRTGTGPQLTYTARVPLMEALGAGGPFRVNVDGWPVYFQATANGPVPEKVQPVPNKQQILAKLN